jgi:hypothetical protein
VKNAVDDDSLPFLVDAEDDPVRVIDMMAYLLAELICLGNERTTAREFFQRIYGCNEPAEPTFGRFRLLVDLRINRT